MYLDGNATHQEYYAQFVTPDMLNLVERTFGKKALQDAFDKGAHLNAIPFAKWDALAPYVSADMKPMGDYRTLAGCVCILKAAARQIINES